ncbi:MAG TPA: DUF2474 family protein [Steroidobacteraceae bacterium]
MNPPGPRARRLLWFVGLWAASVTAMLAVAAVLRWFFGRILS